MRTDRFTPSHSGHLRVLYAQFTPTLALADLPRLLARQLVRASSLWPLYDQSSGALRPDGCHHPRSFAGSGLHPLTKILDCCQPQGSFGPFTQFRCGGCLTATGHRLGRPLPYQPSCSASGPSITISSYWVDSAVLLARTPYPKIQLACLKRATSVRCAPGSNAT